MSSHGFHPFGGRVSRHFGENLSPDDAYLSCRFAFFCRALSPHFFSRTQTRIEELLTISACVDHDVRLTRDDVDCIKDDWLTDNVIAFYEESVQFSLLQLSPAYLEHEQLPAFPSARVNLLRPSMCFMLVQTPDPLTLKEALPSFQHSSHIFLPINDCRSPTEAEGGSHWSLLVVSILDGVAFHYDSLRPTNKHFAEIAAHKLGVLLGKTLRFLDLEDAPQQDNGSDCGVFVCLEIRVLLLHRLLSAESSMQITMNLKRDEIDAAKGRKELLRLIEEFRREGKRRSQSRSRSPFRASVDSKDPPRVGD